MTKNKLSCTSNCVFIRSSIFVVIVLFIFGCNTLQKQVRQGWAKKELAPGVILSNKYFTSLFNAPQNINIITVNLHDSSFKINIAYNDSLLETVSSFGKKNNAIAGVNGNFFNTHIGGSVCYLKIDDSVINRTHQELNGTLYLPWLDTAALAMKGNQVKIITRPAEGWLQNQYDFPTIISAGPLLLWNKKIIQQQAHRFNTARHCRTGIGLTKDHRLLIIAVDGQTKEAAGFTNTEFAKLFKTLKCVNAINLDGGGSTTMWVNGEPDSGVISHPTDNKKYDHFGERKVANAILILKR
ncbi:MAG: phosphodiester glycosidase family protein [Bacteroidetes bacterium]|nr:phosphodiester glycosidase family protein [Bacteroidota bacterium]